MKNQQGRRGGPDRYRDDFNSNQGGREQDGGRNESESRRYGGNRGNNSGYEDQDMNSTYGSQGRRGENQGYGSQESNDSYRNFSTQGRNSGLGNQGDYSSYGSSPDRENERNRNSNWNRNDSDWRGNMGDDENRLNQGWRDYQGTEWNSGRSSYQPYQEEQYQPGFGGRGRGESMGGRNQNSGQGQEFGNSYQDSSRNRQGGENGGMGGMGEGFFGGSGEQSHRGKGPKGYQRSDERIEETLNDRLTDDHMLDASEIEVKVSKGEVTLTGTVMKKEDKRRAEEIAEQVSGVSNVENRIRVTKDSGDKNSSSGNQEGGSKMRGESQEKSKAKQTTNGAHV